MKILRFFIRHSLRDLWRNRSRTSFALVCVATGVAAVVALRTIAFMVGDELTTNLAELNRGDIRLYASRSVPELIEVSPQGEPVFSGATVELINEWANAERIDVSAARVGSLVQARRMSKGASDAVSAVLALYVDPETYPFYDSIFLSEPAGMSLTQGLGTPVTEKSDILARTFLPRIGAAGVSVVLSHTAGTLSSLTLLPAQTATHLVPVVISSKLTRESGMRLRVGDVLRFGAADVLFVVGGVAPAEAESLLTTPQTAFLDFVYMPFHALLLQGEPSLPDQIFLRVPLGRDISQAEDSLIAYLEAHTDGETDLGRELRRTTVPELEEQNAEIADVIDDMILVMGLSSLLIGGIGIVNTMLVVVSRRTLEIAVLKTLGLKAFRVTQLFLLEALLMGLVGSIVGVALGVALSYSVKGVGETAFSLSLEWRLYPEAMLSGVFLGVVITGLFGFLPVLVAGQVRPAIVLRPNEAQLPAAGLLQVLVTIMVMMVVVGLLAGSVVNDALTISPIIMFTGGGALVGLFGGVIVANTRLGLPLPDYYVFRLPRRYERLDLWLCGTAGVFTAPFAGGGSSPSDRQQMGRTAITGAVRLLRQAVLLYGAVAIGVVLTSVMLLTASEVWRPLGFGPTSPPSHILAALDRCALGTVVGWIISTMVLTVLVRRGGQTLGAIIGLGSLGATFGGALGLSLGYGLRTVVGDHTVLWRSLSEIATGVVLVEGALVILSAVFVGYWLLVWAMGKMPPGGLIMLASMVTVGMVLAAAISGASLGVGVPVAVGGTLIVIVLGLKIRQRYRRARAEHDHVSALHRARNKDHHGGIPSGAAVVLMVCLVVASLVLVLGNGHLADVWLLVLWIGSSLALWRISERWHSVDARLVLREMSGRRSRVASTLLGLSVGIAGLSIVALSTSAASRLLENQLGESAEGNLLIITRQADQGEAVKKMLETSIEVQESAQFTTYRGVLVEINGETVERPAHAGFDQDDQAEGRDADRAERGVATFLSERADMGDLPEYKMKSGRMLGVQDAGTHRVAIRESFFTEEMGISTGDKLLYLFENLPGPQDDRLMLFTVIGIVARNSERSGLDDLGDQFVVPTGTLSDEGVLPFYVVTIASVDESSDTAMDTVLQRVSDIPGAIAFELGALTQLVKNLVEQLKAIPTLVAWLALVAGTAIIANTVALATQERRRQIGIMKAVGLKGWRVLAMLMVENGLIGLLAGLIGVGVGFVITVVLVLASQNPSDLKGLVDVASMGWLILLSVAVAVGAACLAAWGAIGEKPMNVLRYD